MNIRNVAVYGMKDLVAFKRWIADNAMCIVCYIDDMSVSEEHEGIPILDIDTFIETEESHVDAILVNHMWNISNSNGYFDKLRKLKKPILWNTIAIESVDERILNYSNNLLSMHMPHGINDISHLVTIIKKYNIDWNELSDLILSHYDVIEEHTYSILERTYKYALRLLGGQSSPLDFALECAGIYRDLIHKKRSFPYGDEYCYGPIRPQEGDRVVSAGGDVGHEIPEFLSKIGRAGHVVIFEASRSSFSFLRNKYAGDSRVRVVNLALHSTSGEIDFFESVDDPGVSSVIAERHDERSKRYPVESITLDEYFEQHSLQELSYIKMDIEGAEHHALKGSEKLIKAFMPKLAICVYHTNPLADSIHDEDIFRIPELIRKMVPDYQLTLVNTELTPWGGMKLFGMRQCC